MRISYESRVEQPVPGLASIGLADALDRRERRVLSRICLRHAVCGKPKVELAVRHFRVALHMMHPPGGLWNPPVVACSTKTKEGLAGIWDLVGQHRAKLESVGELAARRADQRIKWMRSLVDDRIRTSLRGSESIRNLTERLEEQVRSGRVTAATASDRIIEVLGLRRRVGR
jgi:putative protein kinase ArgK-like GTPase of G3E family